MDKHPDHAYRVIGTDTGWEVTVFHKNEVVGPVTFFSDEALPEWTRKEVALLKLVDPQGHVPGIGHRVGQVFWLLPHGTSAYKMWIPSTGDI
jgi:hypothetical protein